MKITVRDNKGKETNKVFELNADIFESKANPEILRQAMHVHLINTRTGTAKTKGRGEVSGTGKKPWANNKIEKARTGDLRTPIFRGGGVSHGPLPMNYAKKMTVKMAKHALHLALTDSAAQKKIVILENVALDGKQMTKTLAQVLENVKKEAGTKMRRAVVYYTNKESNMHLAARNLPYVKALLVTHVDPFDLVRATDVIFLEEAMEVLNKSKAVEAKKPAATATKEAAPKAAAATAKKAPAKAKVAAKTTTKAKAKTK